MQGSSKAPGWRRRKANGALVAISVLLLAVTATTTLAQPASGGATDDVATEAALNRAVLLFSAGDYERAIEQLEPIAPSNAVAAQYLEMARQLGPAPDSGSLEPDWLKSESAPAVNNFSFYD